MSKDGRERRHHAVKAYLKESFLKSAGARELSALATRAWGDVAAYFADLDGNVLVLAQPTASTADGSG